jgi:hypothetical protein
MNRKRDKTSIKGGGGGEGNKKPNQKGEKTIKVPSQKRRRENGRIKRKN